MEKDVDIDEMALAVYQLVETLEDLLKYGKHAAEESISEFVNNKIGKLFGMAVAYEKCFQRIRAQTKDEMEQKIHRYARNAKLREASTDLLDVEQEWDSFLKDIDNSLDGDSGDAVKLNETGPVDVPLTDARSSCDTSLRNFINGGGTVVVISFGLEEGAKKWLVDTDCTFPMLLDTDRKIYHTFGLKRSVLKVWGVASLVYYAEAMHAGKSLPKPYENVHDDTQQMGGDFIVDSDGVVRFMYPSKTSTDRPSVLLLIDELKKIKAAKS